MKSRTNSMSLQTVAHMCDGYSFVTICIFFVTYIRPMLYSFYFCAIVPLDVRYNERKRDDCYESTRRG